ncbi:MAG: NAD-reducing hydrogenase HoxS subunit alpha, partial [Pseudomonadota bacterium]
MGPVTFPEYAEVVKADAGERMNGLSHSERQALRDTLQACGTQPHRLLQVLRAWQSQAGWVSPSAMAEVAQALAVPLGQVQAVVAFYAFLHDRPQGRWRVRFSDHITDRMAGSPALVAQMLARLGVGLGELSAEGRATVGLTSCIGMGDQGPAMLVNERAMGRLTPERIDQVCELILSDTPMAAWPRDGWVVDDLVRRADVLLRASWAPGAALRAAVARGPQAMLDELKRAQLRGRGGAGFTTAVKWEAAREAPGDFRCIVCNADEGEPGTFKDRVLLHSHASRVIEGMAIAAHVVGASRGFIYLRGEYTNLLPGLEAELQRARQAGLLGRGILGVSGFDFDIEVHVGAGAYICGEETALLESLEGKPGRPRIRPPFPVTQGYLGRPTVVNNVETLCKVLPIALEGGERFAGLGTRQSTGTKLLSVSGDVARPGTYEYPFGVTIAQVLADAGGTGAQAVQVSGPAGVCVAASEFERRIAFEDVPTAGAFM